MRTAVIGLVVGFLVSGLWWAVEPTQSAVFAQRPQTPTAVGGPGVRSAAGGEMLVLSTDLADGRQQLVLIDVRTRALGVYHVERGSGQIALKSVRNIQGDLMMDEFNAGGPVPREIRSLLDSR